MNIWGTHGAFGSIPLSNKDINQEQLDRCRRRLAQPKNCQSRTG